MSASIGLLGYFGGEIDPERLGLAQNRAPWRGEVTGATVKPFGAIYALGAAELSQHGHISVALHGRIDNLVELANQYGVAPDSPGGVITALYLKHGDGFAHTLLGDFAILVLDEQRRSVLGVRDWVGTRPLFWGQRGDVTAFGSEVKQVLALLNVPYQLDEQTAIAYRTRQSIPFAATFAKDVFAVESSGQTVAELGRAARSTRREIHFDTIEVSMSDAADLIRTRLDIAVQRRLTGARRPGALISGGMDSTAVAATAASLAERGLAAPLIAGIGLHFPDVPGTDETRYAIELAERCEIPWHPASVYAIETTSDPTASLALHDGPIFPGIQFFERMFGIAGGCDIDILLTGQGADVWQSQMNQEFLFSVLRHEWGTAKDWARYYLQLNRTWAIKRGIKTAQAVIQRRDECSFFAERIRSYSYRNAFESEERLGQFYGIQVEAPFADRELAEVFVGLSPRLRSEAEGEKMPLRLAMAQRMPESILTRMDKSFFDPVFVAGFGPPEESETVVSMVAGSYMDAWDRFLESNTVNFTSRE
jgi:asparagine synthetase B (glutamine-hydrolysing)